MSNIFRSRFFKKSIRQN